MKDSTLVTVSKISQEMGKNSSFDVTSIFVIISLVLFVGILITIIYKVLTTQFKELNSSITHLETQIKESLSGSQKLCSERNVQTKAIVDDSINFINSSIENLTTFSFIFTFVSKEIQT